MHNCMYACVYVIYVSRAVHVPDCNKGMKNSDAIMSWQCVSPCLCDGSHLIPSASYFRMLDHGVDRMHFSHQICDHLTLPYCTLLMP